MLKGFVKEGMTLALIISVLKILFTCVQSSSENIYGFSYFPFGPTGVLGLSKVEIVTIKDPPTGIDLNFKELLVHNDDISPLKIWDERTSISKEVECSQSMRFWIEGDVLNFSPLPNKVYVLLRKRGKELTRITKQTRNSMKIKVKRNDKILFLPCELFGSCQLMQAFFQEDRLNIKTVRELSTRGTIRAILLTIGFIVEKTKTFGQNPRANLNWFEHSEQEMNLSEDIEVESSSDKFTFTYPELDLMGSFGELRIRNNYFGMTANPFCFALSDSLKVVHNQLATSSMPKVFIQVRLVGTGVRIIIGGDIPYALYLYREKKLRKSWESESFNGTVGVQENDVFIACPIGLVWNGKFNASSPLSIQPAKSVELATSKILNGNQAIIFKIERLVPEEIDASPSNTYNIGFMWSEPTIYIRCIEWISSDPGFPTSLAFNQRLVVFGEAMANCPAQFYPIEKFPNVEAIISTKSSSSNSGSFVSCNLVEENPGDSGVLEILFHGNSEEKEKYLVLHINDKNQKLHGLYSAGDKLMLKVAKHHLVEIDRIREGIDHEALLNTAKTHLLGFKNGKVPGYLLNSSTKAVLLCFSVGPSISRMSWDHRKMAEAEILTCNWFKDAKPLEISHDSFERELENKSKFRFLWTKTRFYLPFSISYRQFGIHFTETSLSVSNRLAKEVNNSDWYPFEQVMNVKLVEHGLSIFIKGLIPFSLACYRSDTLMISWSEEGSYIFDDFQVGDRLVLIPWSRFFLKEKPFPDVPKELGELYDRLNTPLFQIGEPLMAIIA